MRRIQASYQGLISIFLVGFIFCTSCTSGGSSDPVATPTKKPNSKIQNPGQITGQTSVLNGGLAGQTNMAGTGVNLKQEQNFDLFKSDGSSIKLSALFNQANYLVMDLSAVSCANCVKDAKDFSADNAFMNLFNSKCQFATLVPNQELANWKNAIGSTTFVGQRSYELRVSHANLANAFGFNLQGIPLLMLIDKTGALVEAKKVLSLSDLPQKLFDLCGDGTATRSSTGTLTSTSTSTSTSTATNTATNTDTETDPSMESGEDPLSEGEQDLSEILGGCDTGGG